MIKLEPPNNSFESVSKDLFELIYKLINRSLECYSKDKGILDRDIYLILDAVGLIKTLTNVRGNLSKRDKEEIAKILNEKESIVFNIIELRNEVAHLYDNCQIYDINIADITKTRYLLRNINIIMEVLERCCGQN